MVILSEDGREPQELCLLTMMSGCELSEIICNPTQPYSALLDSSWPYQIPPHFLLDFSHSQWISTAVFDSACFDASLLQGLM